MDMHNESGKQLESTKQAYYEQVGIAMTCRSPEEYIKMFSLGTLEVAGEQRMATLDVSAGASSFTAWMRARGHHSQAVDPLYHMTLDEIREFGLKEIAGSSEKLAGLANRFDWSHYGDADRHKQLRLASLEQFLTDYASADARETYKQGSLPNLLYADHSFDLVLCSHFLFLYGEQFSYEFHLQAVRELARICRLDGEVRIYPLLDFKWQLYPELELLCEGLRLDGLQTDYLQSELPFIPGSTHMLRIRHA